MKRYLFWFVLVFGLGVINGSVLGQNTAGKMDRVSLCEIVSNPEKYLGKKVEFFAVFSSGFMAPTLLSDPDCDGQRIMPSVDRDYEGFKAFNDKIAKYLKKDDISEWGSFVFIGTLKKNPEDGYRPIKGLLQRYSMILDSFHVPEPKRHVCSSSIGSKPSGNH